MTSDPVLAARSKASVEQVGEGPSDVEQVCAAVGARESDARLNQVPSAVHFVGQFELSELEFGVDSLNPAVQIAAGFLHAGEQSDRLIEPIVEGGGPGSRNFPCGGLHDLVEVGIGEPQAPEVRPGLTDHAAQIVQHSPPLYLLDAVRNSGVRVALLPLRPSATDEANRPDIERPMRSVADGHGGSDHPRQQCLLRCAS